MAEDQAVEPETLAIRTLSGFDYILWKVYVKAKREQKADLFLHRFREALGCEVTVRISERYGKDKALFFLLFTTPLGAPDIQTATFETLRLCQKILSSWTVTGPTRHDGPHWSFRGTGCNKAQGLEMIDFEVRNFVFTTEVA